MPTPSDTEWAQLKRLTVNLESNCPRPLGVDLEVWLYGHIQRLKPLLLPPGVATNLIELAYLERVAEFSVKGGRSE